MVVICEHRAMRLLLFGLDSSQTLLQRTTIFFLKVVQTNIYTGSVKLVTFQEICGETADVDTDRELFFFFIFASQKRAACAKTEPRFGTFALVSCLITGY